MGAEPRLAGRPVRRAGEPPAVQPRPPLGSPQPAVDASALGLGDPVEQVAPRLLGWQIVHGDVRLRITEVEAYAGRGQDPGSHAYGGLTARNAVMFGPPGRAYLYFTYGMHWCLNVVTGPEGAAAAILLRAGQVSSGLDVVRSRRPGAPDRDLARGPARLTRALDVDGSLSGTDLLDRHAALRLQPGQVAVARAAIAAGPRVGVRDLRRWRFWLLDDPYVSPYRPAARPRPRAVRLSDEPLTARTAQAPDVDSHPSRSQS